MTTVVTPCRGRGALYDAVLNPVTPTERRRNARLTAAALCDRCPITASCPDRITAPTAPPRQRKATTTMTEAEMAPAAPAIVSAAEELLAWGDQHPSRRVQTLAERARTALADLAHTQDKEKAVSAAEARVQRLQEQLAKAQAELRDAKGPGAAPEATPKAPKRSKEESLRIRQWARENGHECPTAGIIPQHIVGAYEVARVPRLAVAG